MGRFVIVAYTPKPGMEQRLLATVARHVGVLKAEQLVTDRPPCIMRGVSGAIVEIFEWRSAGAVQRAHENPAVQALWEEFAAVCEYTPLSRLDEAQQMFAEFEAVAP